MGGPAASLAGPAAPASVLSSPAPLARLASRLASRLPGGLLRRPALRPSRALKSRARVPEGGGGDGPCGLNSPAAEVQVEAGARGGSRILVCLPAIFYSLSCSYLPSSEKGWLVTVL